MIYKYFVFFTPLNKKILYGVLAGALLLVLASFVGSLSSTVTYDNVLANYNRAKIYHLIKEKPGIHFSEIVRTLEMSRPIAVAVDEDAPADLAAELYAEPVPAEVAETPAASAAKPADELMAEIGPELRQQLHDTLEKIAWESFGDLTDAIVRQSVERVESIAWEVIPRMAETLIQEEIRRMKSEPEED